MLPKRMKYFCEAWEYLKKNIDIAKVLRSSRNCATISTPTSKPMQQASKLPSTQSISSSVKAGVIIGGAVSVTNNLHQVLTKGKKANKAAKDIAIDVASAGVSSATIAATAEGLKFAVKSALPSAAKSFTKGSAPVVIASGLVELGVDAYKGELTAKKSAVTVAQTAGGWAGAEAGAMSGAAIGAFLAPATAGASVAICAFIGGIAGGIGGSLGAGKLAKLLMS